MKFRIQKFKTLNSTNSKAFDLAGQGEAEGLVVVANYQTAGRGRLSRKWVSPPNKNLLFSILLRPPIAPNEAPILTQIACRTIQHILKTNYELPATLKAPNDVMVHKKKICGILVQSRSLNKERLDCAIVGIGLNVNASVDELIATATSMKELMGKDHNRDAVLKAILKQFAEDIKALYASNS